jgi:hypothetical protein
VLNWEESNREADFKTMSNKKFSLKPMYADYMNGHMVFLKKILVEDKGTTQNSDLHVVPL